MRGFAIFLCISTMLFACKKQPESNRLKGPLTACFNVPIDTLYVGDTLIIGNCSVNADSFLFDFGDGASSRLPDPTHVFSRSGSYAVTLRASNAGQSDSITKLIKVNSAIPAGLPWRYFTSGSNTDSMRFEGRGRGEFTIRGYAFVLGYVVVNGIFAEHDSFTFHYSDSQLYLNGNGSFLHSDSIVNMQYTMVVQQQNGNPQISQGAFYGFRR
ncbi:MAG: PKD domain-containing protein [Bacteroidetes bacterium]|nr:PKD domain-containing protein [Bacteroidota bacterium]